MEIPEHEIKTNSASIVKSVPLFSEMPAAPMPRYICESCQLYLDEDCLIEGMCPKCRNEVKKTCVHDHACDCALDITGGKTKCPTCGIYTCPCGCHDVIVLSRITGYYAELGGWGSGKLAEFEDRTRYDDVV